MMIQEILQMQQWRAKSSVLSGLGEPSKPKNGEKRDIVQKGGRGLGQNPSFKLSRKNDMSTTREGAMM